MSQENVDAVRQVYEAWSRGDFRTGLGVYDPHVVFVERIAPDSAGAYLGLDGIAEYMRLWLPQWSDITLDAEELIDAGESVVVAVHQRGTGRKGEVPAEVHYFHVWTFRAGSVIRLDVFRERAEALEAVGLSE